MIYISHANSISSFRNVSIHKIPFCKMIYQDFEIFHWSNTFLWILPPWELIFNIFLNFVSHILQWLGDQGYIIKLWNRCILWFSFFTATLQHKRVYEHQNVNLFTIIKYAKKLDSLYSRDNCDLTVVMLHSTQI
jgi:hypothetical protein